jgi:hypothetical protein
MSKGEQPRGRNARECKVANGQPSGVCSSAGVTGASGSLHPQSS